MFDQRRRLLVVYGGSVSDEQGTYQSETLDVLNVSSGQWRVLYPNVTGGPVGGRSWGRLTWFDETQDTLMLFSGIDITGFLSPDVLLIHMGNLSFSELATSGALPPPAGGYAMTLFEGHVFLMYGYYCIDNFEQNLGGDACHGNTLYVLNTATRVWTAVPPPPGAGASSWPSRRNYPADAQRGSLWYLYGGAYADEAGSYVFFDDLWVLDLRTRGFFLVDTRGASPRPTWSGRSVVVPPSVAGDDARLWFFGGCDESGFYNDLFRFHFDRAAVAASCKAEGAGLARARAGEPATFTVTVSQRVDAPELTLRNETLECEQSAGSSAAAAVPASSWGAPLPWASGLRVEAVLVGEADCSAFLATVSDDGAGHYTLNYTARGVGRSARLFVNLADDCGRAVPGSPFEVEVEPAASGGAQSRASGDAVREAVRGKSSSLILTLADAFGNPARQGGEAARIALRVAELGNAEPEDSRVVDLNNGSYLVTFTAPASLDAFSLAVTVDGAHVRGSPFRVAALEPLEASPIEQNVVWALSALAASFVLFLSVMLFVKRTAPDVRASSPRLLQLLLLGCLVAVGALALPAALTDLICTATLWMSGLATTTVLLVIAATTWRTARIFTSKVVRTVIITDGALFARVGAGLLLESVILSAWTASSPPSVRVERDADKPVLEKHSCSSDNAGLWFFLFAVPKLVLVLYCIHLANRTRSIPKAFNASGTIGIAVYNFTLTGAAIAALSVLLVDDPARLFVVRSVLALWIVAFTAGAAVAPKVLRRGIEVTPATAGPLAAKYVSASPHSVKAWQARKGAGDRSRGPSVIAPASAASDGTGMPLLAPPRANSPAVRFQHVDA
jgi:hypothetical protein